VTEPAESARRAQFARRMRGIGVAVLALGLCAAAAVFALAPAEEAGDDAGGYAASINESKQYQLAMERIGGKAVVLAAAINDWFDSLWHGRRLAFTLATLSVAVSSLCFLLARLTPP